MISGGKWGRCGEERGGDEEKQDMMERVGVQMNIDYTLTGDVFLIDFIYQKNFALFSSWE